MVSLWHKEKHTLIRQFFLEDEHMLIKWWGEQPKNSTFISLLHSHTRNVCLYWVKSSMKQEFIFITHFSKIPSMLLQMNRRVPKGEQWWRSCSHSLNMVTLGRGWVTSRKLGFDTYFQGLWPKLWQVTGRKDPASTPCLWVPMGCPWHNLWGQDSVPWTAGVRPELW